MMQGKPSEGKVFDFDIAKYVAASQIENYLSQGFKDRYEYPLRSFVFHPIKGVRLEEKTLKKNFDHHKNLNNLTSF